VLELSVTGGPTTRSTIWRRRSEGLAPVLGKGSGFWHPEPAEGAQAARRKRLAKERTL
jgi:hypothetical protein